MITLGGKSAATDSPSPLSSPAEGRGNSYDRARERIPSPLAGEGRVRGVVGYFHRLTKLSQTIVQMVSVCMMLCPGGFAAELEKEVPGGHKIPWESYQNLVDSRQFPTLPEMSHRQLAEKFDLTLPAMAQVKAAVEANDDAALVKAFADYLNTRLPPRTITPDSTPPTNLVAAAEHWMGNSIELKGITVALGERPNWYTGNRLADSEPLSAMGGWIHPLGNAYAHTNDPRYAQRMMAFIRSLYHDARPPAQRPKGWHYLGPWQALWSSGRVFPNYLPYAYQMLGKSSAITDEDRVMFLKMFVEHAEHCARLLDKPHAHNFAVHVLTGLTNVCRLFPEFKDRPAWLKLIGVRYVENMRAAILDDGAAFERSAYHWAFLMPYQNAYLQLKELNAPLPPEFAATIERMYEWGNWMLAPGLEWPLYSHGGWHEYSGAVRKSLELFPNRPDYRYFSSDGKEGAPPSNLARVLHHSGFATMRSDWTTNALYMAIKWNNFLAGQGGKHDIMSFGVWANGHPWMTNPGSTAGYDQLEYDDWCHATESHNTIEINWRRHDIADNTGRLESWASLPGFTYLAAVSSAYASQHAEHRRAVLFIHGDPGYWLMYDLVAFDDPPNTLIWYPFDVTWHGHFQPTELTVDATTKTIATAPKDGKRFYVIPADAAEVQLQQDSGPICSREGAGFKWPPYQSSRAIGPWIKLRGKSAYGNQTGLVVLLYPTKNNAIAPKLETLPVVENGKQVGKTVAFGCRVVHPNGDDDLIAISRNSARRTYGDGPNELTTDGEVAFVRRRGGEISDCGVHELRNSLLHRQPELRCAGHDLGARVRAVGRAPGKITVSKPQFSTAPADICRAAGVVYGYGAKDPDKPETGYLGPPRSVVVSWTTDVPADSTLEYRPKGETAWRRSINPELRTDHRILLSGIEPGGEYELRLTSVDAEGHIGQREMRLAAKVTNQVRR